MAWLEGTIARFRLGHEGTLARFRLAWHLPSQSFSAGEGARRLEELVRETGEIFGLRNFSDFVLFWVTFCIV